MKKKELNISKILWKNYIIMVIVSSVLIIVPFFLMVIATEYMRDNVVSLKYTAESIMSNKIENIKVEEVVSHHGGVQVITKELDVIHLGGLNTIPSSKLTISEWTDFLIKSESYQYDNYTYSITYNEKEEFWLIVAFPVSFTFQIYFNYSTDSVDYDRLAWLVYGIFAIYISLIIVSAIIYSRITVKRFVSPIKKLTSYMEKLEKGDYEEREDNSNLYEFNSLQQGFNKLAIELKKQESMRQEMQENRNRLFRDISHDLKNPLASIQGYIELYLNKKDMTKETQDKYLGIIYNNSIRANLLIHSLFQFAQVNSSDFNLDMKQIDICELMRSKMATFIPVLEERNFIYDINIPAEDIICMLDVVQMNRVFDNLFDNAIKYNEEGTHITVTIFKMNHFAHIEISDNGIGIDEKDTEALFEPFVRADENVRNSQTGGSGLGLAIVKRIVELHNGEIKLVSQIRKGCTFILIFPTLH